jgi:hypothetical protein
MKILTLKKTRFLFLSSVLALSVSASYAQKSIYDVVPGSGPKKTSPDKRRETSVPGVINGHDDRRDSRTVYHHRKRKHLPPGQAKKIYGGEAKDYAPGQVKKHHHKGHGGHHKGKGKRD